MLHLSCVCASRIALSGTYISKLESKECGTSAVTPGEIFFSCINQHWVWDKGRKHEYFYSPKQPK